ncbi:inactive pancreatic lipase-related protein 1-like [Physella acuta]|uniref:inactive pancreatic lipase-related protein 1-like n=1 Tax=Physella acuta TaxID=109671 RepID=UPI0027DE5EBE|nr:inactive pancreatic lipase-related protein 1-like [Physella acuta]
MLLLVFYLLYVGITVAQGSLTQRCFSELGCFSILPPFVSLPSRPVALLPEAPEQIGTVFKLYSRDQSAAPRDLEATQVTSSLKTKWSGYVSRPTKFIVHGFLTNVRVTNWPEEMKDELLKQGDYNVIIVDWSGGNKPPYTQATANTRVVGAQIALLINAIIATYDIPTSQFHIIGHSLGSHIAGYAGERVPGLGRITGLDPAGPFFEGTDPKVRLDPTDAVFVDVIHTDAGSILLSNLGIRQAVGHQDFYPNSGSNQPGCFKTLITSIEQWGLIDGTTDRFICNHMRAVRLFIESINSRCRFDGYPCTSALKFITGACKSCGTSSCATMGFWANKDNSPQGQFYLNTAGQPPFCLVSS